MRNVCQTGLLVMLTGIFLWSECSRKDDKTAIAAAADVQQKALPDREGWDASIRISSNGQLQAIIDYGHMTYFENQQVNYFDGSVQVDMFDRQGRHTTQLNADSGRYHENTQDIWAMGNVIVVSDTGVVLKTPVMKWDQAIEKIISDTTVMVTTSTQDTIYGTAFRSDPDLTHMVIENPSGSRQEGIDFARLEDELNQPVDTDTVETQ